MTTLTRPEDIQRFHLLTLRQAVRLEMLGMKRRGASAATVAKQLLGLPKSTPNAVVFERLTEATAR
jgi:hypothetical protein